MNDEAWMRHALRGAAHGLGTTWPNPSVGCVLVRESRLISEGYTAPGGRPHAEVQALAGTDARGATAYVTLEPCAHHGQTPPCTDALIAAGIARAVIAVEDSDPRVKGQGQARLEAAGIAVEAGLMAAEAREINAGFFKRVEEGRPYLTLKLATTLDARIATRTGESQWITSPMARLYAHHLRAHHDAVLIGAGTARADNPSLTVRGLGLARKPVRIIADASLSLPLTSHLAQTAAEHPLWLLTRAGLPPERIRTFADLGAKVLETPTGETGRLDLAKALKLLAEQGLTRILCEGGGQIAAALLRAGLVDQLIRIEAGTLIGADGLPAIGPLSLEGLKDAPAFRLTEARPLGPDRLSIWQPSPP
ncbi:MAG: bifunctional diaminohydroxyphosphoribosylaminopyrimidine deaminase/5-amino-6-(5-phosphoribosylamino)uracil reductase RibD [Pseudomonadota bacterium]